MPNGHSVLLTVQYVNIQYIIILFHFQLRFHLAPPTLISTYTGRVSLMTTAEDLELSDSEKVQPWSTDSGMESMTDSNKDLTPTSENFDDDEEVR